MKRQINISQMKEHDNTLEEELNKIGARNIPDAEFKTLISRMLNELREELIISVRPSTKR